MLELYICFRASSQYHTGARVLASQFKNAADLKSGPAFFLLKQQVTNLIFFIHKEVSHGTSSVNGLPVPQLCC